MSLKKRGYILLVCILAISTLTGCMARNVYKRNKKTTKEVVDVRKEEKEKKEEEKKEEEDIIVAGSVDTDSKFTFSVIEAIIGMEMSTEEPVVVLACSFTNNSEEPISFSWALEATAVQSGYTLKNAYLSGVEDANYDDILPGNTIPILIGWKILDAENEITLSVVDSQHYAKQEIYAQTFTIDELIENTENYQDSEEIVEEMLTL